MIDRRVCSRTCHNDEEKGRRARRQFERLIPTDVGDYTLLRNMSVDELMEYAANEWNNNERIDRLEMLAELLYAEGS